MSLRVALGQVAHVLSGGLDVVAHRLLHTPQCRPVAPVELRINVVNETAAPFREVERRLRRMGPRL
jgi:hypothetical protein